MNCKQPVVMTGGAFPCGQCLPCRINRRRIWAHRIMLEAAQYSDNCFATLTYNDEHLPDKGHLCYRDLQLFIKRLRKSIAPDKIRYFAVGEYGDETLRPHYHLAIFGYPTCNYGTSTYSRSRRNCCTPCDMVRDAWKLDGESLGSIQLGTLESASASYIARYVAKKFSHKKALGDRPPEFARMSLRPGIGGDAIPEIASQLMKYALDEKLDDVPLALRHGSKLLPLGRYLRRRLRSMIGKEANAPQAVLEKLRAELRPMLDAAQLDTLSEGLPKAFHSLRLRDNLAKQWQGKTAAIEGRTKIFNSRGKI